MAQTADGRIQGGDAAIHIMALPRYPAGKFGRHDEQPDRDCDAHPCDCLPQPDAKQSRRPAVRRLFFALTLFRNRGLFVLLHHDVVRIRRYYAQWLPSLLAAFFLIEVWITYAPNSGHTRSRD